MLSKRKKRALNRKIEHLNDTHIIFIGIEGGDENSSREARYFDVFKEQDIRFQFKVIPCNEHRSSPDQVLYHLKQEIEKEPLQEDDEKWLVVDVDKFEKQLREVGQHCIDAGIQLAVSNPCFEYWLLLHFLDPSEEYVSCGDVKKEFSKQMENNPNKGDGYSGVFREKVEDAITRASKRDIIEERWPNKNGSRVYKIIERFF